VSDAAIGRLDALAAEDAALAPMASLLALALRAAEEPGWGAPRPALDPARLSDGLPLLQGVELPVDAARLQRHFEAVAGAAGLGRLRGLDAIAPVAASLRQDADAVADLEIGRAHV